MLIVTAVVSIIAGVLICVVCDRFRDSYSDVFPLSVMIGLAFVALLFLVGLTVLILSSAMLTFRADILSGQLGMGRVILLFLVGTIVVGCLGGVFQFLYQTDLVSGIKTSGDYIFLIDDSPSMTINDPNQQRYSALKQILESRPSGSKYMVYAFATDAKLVQPMTSVKEGVPTLSPSEVGPSTRYGTVLSTVIDDYEKGVWQSSNPVVIFFTDGYPMDTVNSSILNRFVSAGIPINTVGLGDVDTVILNWISSETGGTFVDIKDTDGLTGAFTTAVNFNAASRDLFSARSTEGSDWLYGTMRVVMVAVLGALIGLVCALCYGNSGSFSLIVVSSIIKSILAGLILELGINLLELPESIMTLLALVLIGTVIAGYGDPSIRKKGGEDRRLSTRGSTTSDNVFDNFME